VQRITNRFKKQEEAKPAEKETDKEPASGEKQAEPQKALEAEKTAPSK